MSRDLTFPYNCRSFGRFWVAFGAGCFLWCREVVEYRVIVSGRGECTYFYPVGACFVTSMLELVLVRGGVGRALGAPSESARGMMMTAAITLRPVAHKMLHLGICG